MRASIWVIKPESITPDWYESVIVLIVESRALHAVASAACLAKSVTPHPVNATVSVIATSVIRVHIEESSTTSRAQAY